MTTILNAGAFMRLVSMLAANLLSVVAPASMLSVQKRYKDTKKNDICKYFLHFSEDYCIFVPKIVAIPFRKLWDFHSEDSKILLQCRSWCCGG